MAREFAESIGMAVVIGVAWIVAWGIATVFTVALGWIALYRYNRSQR